MTIRTIVNIKLAVVLEYNKKKNVYKKFSDSPSQISINHRFQ
jgi:hypothetical protein